MLLFPLGPDQAIFAYIAHHMLMGGFPYVAAWDQKPPAIYLLYVAALKFPGAQVRDVRLFDLFMLCLTLGAIYLLGLRLWGRWAGALAALLYGVAYTIEYGYWYTAQPDGYTALPLCLALWLYYRSLCRRRLWPYVGAGILIGFAFQLRFFSALIGLVLLMIEWEQIHFPNVTIGSVRGWPAIRRLLWVGTGFLVMQALFGVYLFAGHALGAYLFTEFRFATAYAHLGGPYSPNGFQWNLYLDAARASTVDFVVWHLFIAVPAGAAIGLSLWRRGDRRSRQIGLAALVAFVSVLAQAKFFLYHWLAVLPFLALLGGRGLALAAESLARIHRRPLAGIYFAGLLALLVFLTPQITDNALHQWRGVAQYYGGGASRERFNNQFGAYAGGTYSYLADDQVARYLQDHTAPGDTIYVYGYEALIYLISGRESASRFFYVFPVISTWSPAAWKAEFYNDLETKQPRYILVQANEGAPWITGLHEDTAQFAAHDARLQALLAAHYTLETQIEDFTVYRFRG